MQGWKIGTFIICSITTVAMIAVGCRFAQAISAAPRKETRTILAETTKGTLKEIKLVSLHTDEEEPERIDFDLTNLSIVGREDVQSEAEESGDREIDGGDCGTTDEDIETNEDDSGDAGFSEPIFDEVYVPEASYGTENQEPEEDLTYLGLWTATAYCPCEICTGEYASGYTASGTLAEEGRTCASNSLPMGSVVLIDGSKYVVEDTGYTPYGDAWVDIFFQSHESALAFGVREVEVYLINREGNIE